MAAGVIWMGEGTLAEMDRHLKQNVTRACLIVHRKAKQNVRVGGDAGFETSSGGAGLVGSIKYEVYRDRRNVWEGRVGTNLIYSLIHEVGGTIVPKNAEYLHFKVDGHWVKTKVVHMPARPYLRPALDSKRAEVLAALTRRLPERVRA